MSPHSLILSLKHCQCGFQVDQVRYSQCKPGEEGQSSKVRIYNLAARHWVFKTKTKIKSMNEGIQRQFHSD